MSVVRRPLAVDAPMALVAAATAWATLTAWSGFITAPRDLLVPAALLALAIAVSGVLLRWAGAPRLVTLLGQLAVATCGVSLVVTGDPLPLGGALVELSDALATAVDSAQRYAAPIGADLPPVTPLLVAGAALFALLFDAVACTLRRVPVAGLVLLAIYAIPAGLASTGAGWVSFVLAAVGFLTLLHLDARSELLRWGRAVGHDAHSPWAEANPLAGALRAGAGAIGVGAIALALVIPPFVPVLELDALGFGDGAGKNQITIRNPRADLRRDLEQGDDVPLVQVRTNDPAPSYLRIAVLNRFTGDEWSSGDRDVASSATANRKLPPPSGLSEEVPRRSYEYDVTVAPAFDSTWLPTQFPISAIHAEGDWRYDEDTYDFLAAGDETTAGMEYTMRSIVPAYGTDGRFFADAVASSVTAEVLEIPGGLPSSVRTYAEQVTAGARNDYERARLLQAWFRIDGGFRYSLAKAPGGSIGQSLATFLSDAPGGRIGYCEQFAAAMAIMARIAGIPARVAVGFLTPTAVEPRVWQYSSHDLHAWPELYFSGAGWVRFEPTPGRRAPDAPAYSTVPVITDSLDPGDDPSTAADGEIGPEDQPGRDQPSRAPEESAATTEEAAGGSGGGGLPLWPLVMAAALAVAGTLVPRLLRSRQRQRRLAGSPEDLWDELRATAFDLGIAWPEGRSPRESAAILAGRLSATAGAAEAMDRLVAELERHRYARPAEAARGGGATAVLEAPTVARDDAVLVCTALVASRPARSVRRAAWLPRSSWQRD
ncbi:transglutaminase domain-containing protein [Nocardioides sp. GY 10113]|uniref:transglutaminase family protein n=1 Tax=Nocardioides sp. GY 10113 TaxID=2569761 RepID=UPI0010A7968E|nr:DUF3488 and transglutaminase-like domain-containing protein [Nocardioides sp. GY 10113]TIC88651.1 transglutaminase domain-containing protein [Nocardioides sp. GY 10113]